MTRASADRVKAVWTGTGTGTMSLGGAAPNEPVQAFPAALSGLAIRYLIKHETAQEAEAGIGVYTHAGATLTRVYRTYPTLGGAAVSFSSGTKFVSPTSSALDLAANVATVDPGSGDNITTGFLQGHFWINTTTPSAWILLNHNVGTTQWIRIDSNAAGGVGISGSVVAGDFPQFIDSTTVQGLTALELVGVIDSLFAGATADYRGLGAETLSQALAAKAEVGDIPTGELASRDEADLPAAIANYRGTGSEALSAAFAAVAGLGTLAATDDAGTTVDIGATTSGTLRYLLSDSAVNVRLLAAAPVGTRVVVVKAGAGVVTVSCLGTAGYFVGGDDHGGTKATASFTVAGWAEFRCRANTTGTDAVFVVDGAGLSLPSVVAGAFDFTSAGIRVPNGAAVSGALTVAAHGGGAYKTAGNCTITPAAGHSVTLLIGGAHTIGAGGTAHTPAVGDVVSVVCFSATNGDVKLFKTVAADVINLPTV